MHRKRRLDRPRSGIFYFFFKAQTRPATIKLNFIKYVMIEKKKKTIIVIYLLLLLFFLGVCR